MVRVLLLLCLFNVGLFKKFVPRYNHGRRVPVICYVDKYTHTHPAPYDYDVSDIPTRYCSHINYAFADIDARSSELKDTMGTFRNFTSLKERSPQLRVMLSVGGWSTQSGYISAIASEKRSRQTFVKSVIETLRAYDFDGLDIFWLFPGSAEWGGRKEDKENYVSLVKEIREAMSREDRQDLLLTVGVPLSPYILDKGYDIYQLNRYVDWMNAIGYELRGKWLNQTDVHSPIVPRSIDPPELKKINVRDGIRDLYERGALKRKVMLGIAFYGRVYKLLSPANNGLHAPIDTKGKPKPGPAVNSTDIYSYTEICKLLESETWVKEFDSEGKCPYAYASNGDEWVGYEDVRSIGYKMNLMRDEGYAGVMVMSSDLDDLRGACGEEKNSLHRAIIETLPLERAPIYPIEISDDLED